MGIAATKNYFSDFEERKATLVTPDLADEVVLGSLEIVVLSRLSEDRTAAEIAEELAYSEITVQTIVDLATRKLGCGTTTAAVATAIRKNLI